MDTKKLFIHYLERMKKETKNTKVSMHLPKKEKKKKNEQP
jgi:hypothetical protein